MYIFDGLGCAARNIKHVRAAQFHSSDGVVQQTCCLFKALFLNGTAGSKPDRGEIVNLSVFQTGKTVHKRLEFEYLFGPFCEICSIIQNLIMCQISHE